MRFSTALVTVAAVAPFVTAHDHDEPRLPKISGLNMRDLKTRDFLSSLRARAAAVAAEVSRDVQTAHEERVENVKRQGGDDQNMCGPGKPSCAEGYCCSEAGYCGTTRVSERVLSNTNGHLSSLGLLLLPWMSIPVWPWMPRKHHPCWREH